MVAALIAGHGNPESIVEIPPGLVKFKHHLHTILDTILWRK